MKQHITKSELEQLSEKGKEKLDSWLFKDMPPVAMNDGIFRGMERDRLLSIGQMIEFLSEYDLEEIYWEGKHSDRMWVIEGDSFKKSSKELSDVLWEVVKKALEKE